jgi:small subunit ribosomal protein S16
MLKIRLTRLGKKNAPTYRIVVTPSTTKRDGKYLHLLGTYNPQAQTDQFKLNYLAMNDWVSKGAQISDGLTKLLKKYPPPAKDSQTTSTKATKSKSIKTKSTKSTAKTTNQSKPKS